MGTEYLSILQALACYGCYLKPRMYQILVIMFNSARALSEEEIEHLRTKFFKTWRVYEVRISQKKIAEECGCSVRTVQRVLKDLNKRGTVEKISTRTVDNTDGSVKRINVYRIFPTYLELKGIANGF